MLYAQLFQKLLGILYATGLHIFHAATNAFYRFLIILLLPCQLRRQKLVQCTGRCLAVGLGLIFQLREAFGFQGNRLHSVRLS